jgi:biotin synthase-like enzyme
MSDEMQALCFMAGANSIFYGEKLLTTGNPDVEKDRNLLVRLGLTPEAPPELAPLQRHDHSPQHGAVPTAAHA